VEGCFAAAVRKGEGHEFGIRHGVAVEIGANQRLVAGQGLECENFSFWESSRVSDGVLAFAGADIENRRPGASREQPDDIALNRSGLGQVGRYVGRAGIHAGDGSAR
jgi:hypothetical protein